jgi:hypothetical protein
VGLGVIADNMINIGLHLAAKTLNSLPTNNFPLFTLRRLLPSIIRPCKNNLPPLEPLIAFLSNALTSFSVRPATVSLQSPDENRILRRKGGWNV